MNIENDKDVKNLSSLTIFLLVSYI